MRTFSLFLQKRIVPVHSPEFSVVPAKAGIQYARLACLAPDWIPAFAGMTMQTLISLLQTGSCPRERLQKIQFKGLLYLAPDWIPAFAGMTMQTLISLLQTGSCPRERLQKIQFKGLLYLAPDWIPAFAGMTRWDSVVVNAHVDLMS